MSAQLTLQSDFPMLSEGKLVYLDSAATTLKPKPVIEAITRYYAQETGTIHRAVYRNAQQATEEYAEARANVQRFLNAKHAEEIIFTKGTTEAINLVASSFGKAFIQEGDEIIISVMEHHSNIVPWQILCKDRGALLRIIPANSRGELCLNAYQKLLGPKTKIVSVGHISNVNGAIHPIQEIVRLARQQRAAVMIDAAQSTPRMPVDVQALDVDFLAFSGHKCYGPTGVGVLYGKKHLLRAMPPYQCGGSMIDQVTLESTSFAALPQKFEAGTPMIASVLGLSKALEYLETIGLNSIFKHEQALVGQACEQLKAIDRVRLIGDAAEKGGILSFVVEGIHPTDLGTLLDLHNIAVRTGHHCAQPAMAHFGVSGTVRLSFGVYNTQEDIALFIAALKDAIAMLG